MRADIFTTRGDKEMFLICSNTWITSELQQDNVLETALCFLSITGQRCSRFSQGLAKLLKWIPLLQNIHVNQHPQLFWLELRRFCVFSLSKQTARGWQGWDAAVTLTLSFTVVLMRADSQSLVKNKTSVRRKWSQCRSHSIFYHFILISF